MEILLLKSFSELCLQNLLSKSYLKQQGQSKPNMVGICLIVLYQNYVWPPTILVSVWPPRLLIGWHLRLFIKNYYTSHTSLIQSVVCVFLWFLAEVQRSCARLSTIWFLDNNFSLSKTISTKFWYVVKLWDSEAYWFWCQSIAQLCAKTWFLCPAHECGRGI